MVEGFMQLSLTADEAGVLERCLTVYLSDLRMEIAETDAHDFRERLKQEESVLTRLVQQLGAR
jgi:hypothetical protein